MLRSKLSGYDLDSPTLDLELPKELKEVSGLVALGGSRVACVQDERGSLYVLDTKSGEVVERIKFAGKGDFEAICRAGARWYALRSDGVLLVMEEAGSGIQLGEANAVELGVPHAEHEALAFDPMGQRLLLAPKDRASEGDLKKREAPVYALGLDPAQGELGEDASPALVIDVKAIEKSAAELDLPLPMKAKKGGKEKPSLRLRISDLAVHPITGQLYVLSGPERTLLVLERDGALVGSAVFPESLLPQPEGVAFEPDGMLFLTSEAGESGLARMIAIKFDGS